MPEIEIRPSSFLSSCFVYSECCRILVLTFMQLYAKQSVWIVVFQIASKQTSRLATVGQIDHLTFA